MGIYKLNSLYTVQEVANKLNLSEQTIRKLIKKGEINVVRIGRNIRISRQELDKIMEAQGQ